jgi:para-nitrobenzyl esterase
VHFSDWPPIPSRWLAPVVAVLAVTAGIAVLATSGLATGKTVARPVARAAQASDCSSGTTVPTSSGPVCGISYPAGTSATGIVAKTSFNQWLGIPYAAPPVGQLRWQPPQQPQSWTTTLAAVTQPPGCPGSGTSTASEDCLQLDITAPTGVGSALPVIFYIHGGGFTGGTTSTYPEQELATSGPAIVVGVEYRLGVLGFLADKALGAHSGDFGLQDQQFAMKWVQQNISAFGGDPANITIMGSSAGASSVCDQIASPTAHGLFEKAINFSGEYNSLFGAPTSLQPQDCKAQLPTQQQANATGALFAASVGCDQGNSPAEEAALAACLRAVPWQTLLTAQASGGTNSPIVNGTTLTEQPLESFATGRVNRVPALLGVNRDEDLTGTATTPAAYTSLIDSQYGAEASEVLLHYPLTRFPSPYVASRTVAADSNTVCPALVRDQYLSKVMPMYAFEGDTPDLPPYSTATPDPPGSSHDWEPGYLFPTAMGIPIDSQLDADQATLRSELISQVTAFAATGSPNTTGVPLWPRYKSNTGYLVMSLQPGGDDELMSAAAISFDHQCAFWDRISPKPER